MTPRTKLEIAGFALVLVAGAILAITWEQSRNEALRLKSTISAQNALIEQARSQMQALQDADSRRDAQTQAVITAMQRAVSKIQTPQQISAWIPAQLPTPSPITFTLPNATPSNPSPDAVAKIPQQDLPALRDLIEGCKECKANLAAKTEDLTSKAKQLQLAQAQLSETQHERDAAVAASRGGSVWRRLRRNATWFLVGFGASAIALHKSPPAK